MSTKRKYDSYFMDQSEAQKHNNSRICLYVWKDDFKQDNECHYFKDIKESKEFVESEGLSFEKKLDYSLGDLTTNEIKSIKNQEAFDLMIKFINLEVETNKILKNEVGLKFEAEYEGEKLDRIVFNPEDFGFEYKGTNIVCSLQYEKPLVACTFLPSDVYEYLFTNKLISNEELIEINN